MRDLSLTKSLSSGLIINNNLLVIRPEHTNFVSKRPRPEKSIKILACNLLIFYNNIPILLSTFIILNIIIFPLINLPKSL